MTLDRFALQNAGRFGDRISAVPPPSVEGLQMKGKSRNRLRLIGMSACVALGLHAANVRAQTSQADVPEFSNPMLDRALAIECSDFLSPDPVQLATARMAVKTAKQVESNASSGVSVTTTQNATTDATSQVAAMTKNLESPESMPGLNGAMSATLESVAIDAAKTSSKLSEALRAMKEFEAGIETGGLADNSYIHNGNLDRAVDARKKLANCAKRNYEAAKKAEETARVAAPESAEAKTAKSNLEEAQRDYIQIAQRAIFDQAQLSLLVGPSFTINGMDKFNTGAEISALFDGGAGSFLNFGRVITEFSYKTTGTVDTAKSETGEAQAIDAATLIRNNPGLIRFNSGFSTTIHGRYSAAITGGLSTIPGGGGSAPKPLRPHGQIALLGRTFLSDGVYSRLSIGYAFDRYWINKTPFDAGNGTTGLRTEKSYNRAVVEGLVFLTNPAAAGGITASGRLTINTPLDGDGPAEVRLSILAAMNFLAFFDKLNPVK